MSNKKILAYYKKIAPMYFRHDMPDVSTVENKKLQKIIKQQMKRRKIIAVKYLYGKKHIPNLQNKSLKQLETLLKSAPHQSKTKKLRFHKKNKTRKLTKK